MSERDESGRVRLAGSRSPSERLGRVSRTAVPERLDVYDRSPVWDSSEAIAYRDSIVTGRLFEDQRERQVVCFVGVPDGI